MRKRENEEDREKGNEEKEMKGKRRGTMSRTQDGQINGGKAVWGFVWRGIGEPQQQQRIQHYISTKSEAVVVTK